jgi:hypothetical protein
VRKYYCHVLVLNAFVIALLTSQTSNTALAARGKAENNVAGERSHVCRQAMEAQLQFYCVLPEALNSTFTDELFELMLALEVTCLTNLIISHLVLDYIHIVV